MALLFLQEPDCSLTSVDSRAASAAPPVTPLCFSHNGLVEHSPLELLPSALMISLGRGWQGRPRQFIFFLSLAAGMAEGVGLPTEIVAQ